MKTINHLLKSLKHLRKPITLSEAEKRHMHAHILSYMNSHPIQEKAKVSPYFSYHSIIFRFASVAVVVLLVGGSTLFAAEGALPGDTLYPVKVGVNEEVKGFFVVGDENVIAWHEERVSTRLKEAETLAQAGKLSDAAQAQVEAYFDSNIQEFNAKLETIKKTDLDTATVAATRFETVLKVHQSLLNKIIEEDQTKEIATASANARVNPKMAVMMQAPAPTVEEPKGLAKLVKRIDGRLASSTNTRIAMETRIVSQGGVGATASTTDKRLKLAEKSLSRATSTADGSSGESFGVNDKIIQAAKFIDEGKVQLDAQNYQDASVSFTKAKLQSDEATILIQVSKQLLKKKEGSSTTTLPTLPIATSTPTGVASSTAPAVPSLAIPTPVSPI